MTRCAQEAADCGFQYPRCDGDLTEYMLLRKVMVGPCVYLNTLHQKIVKNKIIVQYSAQEIPAC